MIAFLVIVSALFDLVFEQWYSFYLQYDVHTNIHGVFVSAS